MKRAKIILACTFFILVLLTGSVFAFTVTKGEMKVFLKKELKSYFEGKDTRLNITEIQELFDFYTKTSAYNINVNDTTLTKNVKDKLALEYNLVEELPSENNFIKNADNDLKEGGELCSTGSECASGACSKRGCSCFALGCLTCKNKCEYSTESDLKGTKEKCSADSECASGDCTCKWPCLKSKKYCK